MPGTQKDMKELLGEILLALQCPLTPEEQQELWQCFESLLNQYVDRRGESIESRLWQK